MFVSFRSHCFEETRNGTLKVQVVGDALPRSIFNKLTAACAYFRMLYAAFYATFVLSRQEEFDVIFLDSISVGIPILKYAAGAPKIIFYCHFPDVLLATRNENKFRNLYRAPLNWAEEITTKAADVILVNSKFTRRIFKETFKSISVMPSVLYPSFNTNYFDETDFTGTAPSELNLRDDSIVFLSMNRFERKKNIPLAVKAFKEVEKHVSKAIFQRCHLILAGGYDTRVNENVQHFSELEQLVDELKVKTNCTMLQSPSDKLKLWLFKRSNAILYTPSNEHFGIVPVEAMYMRRPVIACNSGGPTETVNFQFNSKQQNMQFIQCFSLAFMFYFFRVFRILHWFSFYFNIFFLFSGRAYINWLLVRTNATFVRRGNGTIR